MTEARRFSCAVGLEANYLRERRIIKSASATVIMTFPMSYRTSAADICFPPISEITTIDTPIKAKSTSQDIPNY